MAITQQLSLFLDVVQQGSFTKAAALHDMDNSSLSKQIKKLEANLGVQLLNRSTRSFSLTPAGEQILLQTQRLMDNLEQIQNIADSYQSEPKGNLRIASPVFFGQQYLQPVIADFLAAHPQVHLSLSTDDKKTDIIADHIDVAFRIGKLTDSNLIAKKIANTNVALVASKSFLAKHGTPTTPEALIELPSVIYDNGSLVLDQLQISTQPGGSEMQQLRMMGNYRVGDVRAMMDAVTANMGYALVDLVILDRPIEERGLVPLLTDYRLSNKGSGIFAIYPHRRQTKLVTEFIKAVEQHIGEPPFWEGHIAGYQQMYK